MKTDVIKRPKYLTNEVREQRNEIAEETHQYQLQKLEEMKADLPKYIKTRKRKFAKEWKEFQDEHTEDGQLLPTIDKVPMSEIIEHTFAPLVKVAGISPAWSADEMWLAFEYYSQCSIELNKTGYYLPKIEDFCRLINISRKAFDRYQTSSQDENMREVCNKIMDYCTARTADEAFISKDKAMVQYSIFHQKSSNKQRDNDPIQNNTYIQNNTIMSDEMFRELDDKYSD